MCITLIAFNEHPAYPFILLFNRDEVYQRPTQPLHEWTDPTGIIAGRDSLNGGTWLGINTQGRFCALTNYSENDPKISADFFQSPSSNIAAKESESYLTRGAVPVQILSSDQKIETRLHEIWQDRHRFKSFNLLSGDIKSQELYYFSINREDNMQGIHQLEAKTYCLSNCELDGNWHKISHLKNIFKQYIGNTSEVKAEDLLELMKDTDLICENYSDREASVFVNFFDAEIYGENVKYGTVSTTCILVDSDMNVKVIERVYDIDQETYTDNKEEFSIR